jgi:hypothetical protein
MSKTTPRSCGASDVVDPLSGANCLFEEVEAILEKVIDLLLFALVDLTSEVFAVLHKAEMVTRNIDEIEAGINSIVQWSLHF